MDSQKHVRLVSYTGKKQNVEDGILTLEVGGKEYVYGHDFDDAMWRWDGHLEKFWRTDTDGGLFAYGEELPDELKEYAAEVDDILKSL